MYSSPYTEHIGAVIRSDRNKVVGYDMRDRPGKFHTRWYVLRRPLISDHVIQPYLS